MVETNRVEVSKTLLTQTKTKAKVREEISLSEEEKKKEKIPQGIEIFLESLGSKLDFNNLTLEQVIILTVIKQEESLFNPIV